MTFKDKYFDITMIKGGFSSMVVKVTDGKKNTIANFNCIKD